MKIGCVYTVEAYNSIEQPLGPATNIPYGISLIATVLNDAGHDVELFVITPDTPLDEYIGKYIGGEYIGKYVGEYIVFLKKHC